MVNDEIEIKIKGNQIRFIYNDDLNFSEQGKILTKRASHVEPYQNGWGADMSPINPNAPVLGPFKTRREALKAEHDWLIKHNIPIPFSKE